MTEYNMNIPYARAKYEQYKRAGRTPNNLTDVFAELNFVYGNNGFSETLARDALLEHNGNYLRILESIIKEE